MRTECPQPVVLARRSRQLGRVGRLPRSALRVVEGAEVVQVRGGRASVCETVGKVRAPRLGERLHGRVLVLVERREVGLDRRDRPERRGLDSGVRGLGLLIVRSARPDGLAHELERAARAEIREHRGTLRHGRNRAGLLEVWPAHDRGGGRGRSGGARRQHGPTGRQAAATRRERRRANDVARRGPQFVSARNEVARQLGCGQLGKDDVRLRQCAERGAGRRGLRGSASLATRHARARGAVGERVEVHGDRDGRLGLDVATGRERRRSRGLRRDPCVGGLTVVLAQDVHGLVERDLLGCDEQRARQHDAGERALTALRPREAHGRTQLVGESTDHVEAQSLGTDDLARGVRRRLLVGLVELLVAHAEALVKHGDRVPARVLLDRHDDGRARVGEDGRVLEELGDQVRCGQRVVTEHERVDVQVELDALVQLDLRGSRTDDVGERHRCADATSRLDASEDEQRLSVTTHSRRQVVETEEVGESAGVFLGTLELVEEHELAVEEHLVATRDVDEHLGDRATQEGLLSRDAQRHGVHLVERGGQAPDLVLRGDLDLLDGDVGALAGLSDLLDDARELVADAAGGLREATQGPSDRPRDGERDHDGCGDSGERGGEREEERPGRSVLDRVSVRDGAVA